jgi:hypothetical protein
MEESDVPGTFAVWADALHAGPVPPLDVGGEEWRLARARFVAHAGWATYEQAAETYARWDAALERFREYDEAVIWCEHDLFDQLLLIRHLAWFADRDLGAMRLALICIGEFPGMPAFKGLGELSPGQLASLLGTRQPVTRRQLDLGRRAFRAFTSDDPRHVERFLAEEDTSPLPFLAPALRRLLEEYPSTRNGLSRTEQTMLELSGGGPMRLVELVHAMHARERAYYVTDLTMRELLARFGGERPLVTVVPAPDGNEWEATVALTPLGRDVLTGRRDWIRLCGGIDRWLGGVHLAGAEPAWRWDAEAGRLVKSAGA